MDSGPRGCVLASKARSKSANKDQRVEMGQAKRTTKLLLDLGKRTQGGANNGKRAYLDETAQVLNAGRADLISSSSWHMPGSSKRRSCTTPKSTWKCGSGPFPPMSC